MSTRFWSTQGSHKEPKVQVLIAIIKRISLIFCVLL